MLKTIMNEKGSYAWSLQGTLKLKWGLLLHERNRGRGTRDRGRQDVGRTARWTPGPEAPEKAPGGQMRASLS